MNIHNQTSMTLLQGVTFWASFLRSEWSTSAPLALKNIGV